MQVLDMRSAGFIGLVVLVALSAIMLHTCRSGKTYPGFCTWTAGLVCWTLAGLAYVGRDVIGPLALLLIANPLFIAVAVFMSDGMALFHELGSLRRRRMQNLLIAGLGMAGCLWFRFVDDVITARIFFVSTAVAVLLARAAIEPLLKASVRRFSVQWVISGLLGLFSLVFFLRGVLAATSPGYKAAASEEVLLHVVVLLSIFMAIILVFGFVSMVNSRISQELMDSKELLKLQANTDLLTGLGNRRHFLDAARHDIKLARRYGNCVTLIFFDLDHFKSVNDRFGHAAGDKVLQAIGALCMKVMRDVDTIGRMGGEEFAILMPHVSLDGAVRAAERLRAGIEALRPVEGLDLTVTASFGVAELGDASLEDMLDRADQRLYKAKNEGRNQVCLYA